MLSKHTGALPIAHAPHTATSRSRATSEQACTCAHHKVPRSPHASSPMDGPRYKYKHVLLRVARRRSHVMYRTIGATRPQIQYQVRASCWLSPRWGSLKRPHARDTPWHTLTCQRCHRIDTADEPTLIGKSLWSIESQQLHHRRPSAPTQEGEIGLQETDRYAIRPHCLSPPFPSHPNQTSNPLGLCEARGRGRVDLPRHPRTTRE